MTKTQQRQAAKGKAFNAIVRIYHPKSNWRGDEWDRESSFSEQKEFDVRNIMERYFKEIEVINKTNKKSTETGKTPQQLADENKELLDALLSCGRDFCNGNIGNNPTPETRAKVMAAIKKANK